MKKFFGSKCVEDDLVEEFSDDDYDFDNPKKKKKGKKKPKIPDKKPELNYTESDVNFKGNFRSIYVATDGNKSVEFAVTKDNKTFFLKQDTQVGKKIWFHADGRKVFEKAKEVFQKFDVPSDVIIDISTTIESINKRRAPDSESWVPAI